MLLVVPYRPAFAPVTRPGLRPPRPRPFHLAPLALARPHAAEGDAGLPSLAAFVGLAAPASLAAPWPQKTRPSRRRAPRLPRLALFPILPRVLFLLARPPTQIT